MTTLHAENPHAGQGSVLLDIGGDVGALVVQMPDEMEGVEVDIRPLAAVHDHGHGHDDGHGHDHGHGHGHDHGHGHLPHVAVVRRPVADGGLVASLVYGEVVEGAYELLLKGTDEVCLSVEVRGGEVTEATWPA